VKKLINDPAQVVSDALDGFATAHADLVKVNRRPDYVVRADAPVAGKVALVSGGGSGHEPLHIGYVGRGMLDAAVPGPVFTSPTPDPILAAAKAVDSGAGVLFIVKNYTGDVLNFETAAELAQLDGIDARTVLVDDDVAVQDSTFTAGRRGVAGAVLLEKIVGAAAERGDSLDACQALGERVNARMRSMGVALTACTVPHVGRPSFELADDEIEIGVGLHGEPGRRRAKLAGAAELAAELVGPVLDDLAAPAGTPVLMLVNGMGGTPQSELYIICQEARRLVEAAGLQLARSLVGDYATALEMQGCSVTVLLLDDETADLWDAPVATPALRRGL
jgi:dihydroxyacetone kinase-like protein